MTTWMDLAFSPAVKAAQTRRGSRPGYARMEEKGSDRTYVDESLAAFIAEQRSFYLATASSAGQPYIQHRGGPPGFLHVLGKNKLAFADFTGNRQYISTGNLAENPNAMIFLMDYRARRRVKIWGTARVVEDDPALVERLFPEGYQARLNCPQHIPQMLFAEDVEALAARISELEAENARLRCELKAQ
jgi:predicted pyridoxine 5'-phosphate oxidase superfamily flavin-nucleotide-binding protein